MAKKYAIRNTTTKPPRPLYVVTCQAAGGIPSQNTVLINTDAVPVFLTQSQYDACKDAIARYVKAKMMKLDILEATEKKPLPEVDLDMDLPDLEPQTESRDDALTKPQTKDDYEKYCLNKFGIQIDRRKSLATIKSEVAELEGN